MASSGSTATRRRSAAAASSTSAGSRSEQKAGAKRKRASPGRPGRNAQTASLHAKEAHEAEAEALTSGIGQLEAFIERLRVIQTGTKPEPDELRDWLSPQTLLAMTEVIEENPRPSLEYILGVMGAQEVPKRLAERQRSQGSRAFTAHLRNRAIRRKREAMEQKRKKAAEKPPVLPSQSPKSAKAKDKGMGGADKSVKSEVATVIKGAPKANAEPNVETTAKTVATATPEEMTKPGGPATASKGAADAVQIETDEKPGILDVSSDAQMKPAEQDKEPPTEGETTTNDVSLTDGAAKLEAAVKNSLDSIVGIGNAKDIEKVGQAEQSEKIYKADEPNLSKDAVIEKDVEMTNEKAGTETPRQKSNTQSPGPTKESVEIQKKSKPARKSARKEDSKAPFAAQPLPKENAKARSPSDPNGSRPVAEEISSRPVRDVQKNQIETAPEGKVMENTKEAERSVQETAPKGTTVKPALDDDVSPKRPESSVGREVDESCDANTVMKDVDHLRDGKAHAADHSDELANPSSNTASKEESSKETEAPEPGVKEKMEVTDANDMRTKPIGNDSSLRGIPFKKREKTAVDAGKLRKDIRSEGKSAPTSTTTKATGAGKGAAEKSVRKAKRATESRKQTGKSTVNDVAVREAGVADDAIMVTPDVSSKDAGTAEDKGENVDSDDEGSAAEIEVQRKSGSRKVESSAAKQSIQATSIKNMPTKSKQKKTEDEVEDMDDSTDKIEKKQEKPTKQKHEKARKDKHRKTTEDTPAKQTVSASTKKANEEAKETKKLGKRPGRSSTEAVSKDGNRDGQKPSRKAGPSKSRKPKETETPRERRVGSRRLSYNRGDLVHSSTPQTRLRRESSHLRDPTSLPPDTDPFVVDCFHVWKNLYQDKITIPFQKPVTKKDAPGYFDVIKHPMDLSTVRKHLEDKTIKTPQQFHDEMMLICSNALLFNDVESDLYDLALELRQKIKKAVKPVLSEWRNSLSAAKREGEIDDHPNAEQSEEESPDDSEMVDKGSSSSSESEESSHATDVVNAQRSTTRYPSRRGGDGGHSSATRRSGGRGQKKKAGRGRGRGRGGRAKQTDADSDLEDEDAVVITPSGRGRGRGRRGGSSRSRGTGRRGALTKENAGPGRKPKRGRPPADEDREDGRKRRRVAS